MEEELDIYFSKEETKQLFMMYMQSNGPTTEDKIVEVIKIVQGIKLAFDLNDMALKGVVKFTVLDAEFVYSLQN